MSEAGITFEVVRDQQDRAVDGRVDSGALKTPEAQQALDLLQSRLLVRDAQSGQLEELEIEKVEIYDRGLAPHYAKEFDAKADRKPGSLFVVKFRGTALVNVVVDPATRSVVYVKEVSTSNSDSRSLASNLKRLLGGGFVDQLDGASLDNPAETGVELAPKGLGRGILDIVARVRSKTGASTSDQSILVR